MAIKVTRPQIDLREEINNALTLRGLENQLITVNGLVSNGTIHVKKSGGDAEVEGLRLSHGQVGFANSTGFEQSIALTFDLPSIEAGVESNRVAAKVVGRKGANGTNDWWTNGASTNFNGQLDFYTRKDNVLTNQMTIDENGNVGIGATNPTFTAVSGSTDQIGLEIQNGNNDSSAHLKLTGRNNTGTPGQATSFELIHRGDSLKTSFIHAGTERITIDSSGNITLASAIVAFSDIMKLDGNDAYFICTATNGYRFNNSNDAFNNMIIAENGNVAIRGALSKGSGSFRIPHPVASKTATHDLVHSFLEAPQADNLYRGKVDLVAGSATVNIDTVAGMTEGTFTALNREVQCFTSNETGWTAVKGFVSENTLTITAQDNSCTDTISWMVVGERKDQHMYDTDWTDDNGKVIVEPTKRPDKI
jgi:hypothetical protein